MADDIEVGGPSLAHILAPAAADMVPIGTNPAGGGFSYRSEFVYRNADGAYIANGSILLSGNTLQQARVDDTAQAIYEWKSGTESQWFLGQVGWQDDGRGIGLWNQALSRWHWLATRAGDLAIPGNVGIGYMSPAVRLHVRSSNTIARFDTVTARGSGNVHLDIYDPSGRKGYIGYVTDDTLRFMNELGSITFGTVGSDRWAVESGLFGPLADNAYDIAWAGARVRNIYLGSNPVVTCDVRFKAFRPERDTTAAEHAAALECFDAFGFYQFNDAIEAKGADGARWHYGPAAQEVWAIFASHGLAAPLGDDGLPPEGSIPPAFLCFDTYPEETAPEMEGWRPSAVLGSDGQPVMVKCAEGEEATEQRPTGETIVTREAGNIFGVRIDQLHSLMLKALDHERKAQTVTIADLLDRVVALEPAP